MGTIALGPLRVEATDLMIGAAVGGVLGALWYSASKSKRALPGVPTVGGFAGALLGRAMADLGTKESAHNNTGPRVDEMLRNTGITPPANWCAAAVATWIKEASAALGIPKPIPGSAGVLETMRQLRDPGNPRAGWLDVAQLRANPGLIQPGMLVIWSRGDAGQNMGHIGVVESFTGPDTINTIEGNSGPESDSVSRGKRPLSEPRLLGMGFFREAPAVAGFGYLNNPPGVATFP